MTARTWLAPALLLLLGCPQQDPRSYPSPPPSQATSPAPSFEFQVGVERLEGAISVVVATEVPSAGYSLEEVGQTIDPQSGRTDLTLRLTTPPPDAVVAQVVTPLALRAPLAGASPDAGTVQVTILREGAEPLTLPEQRWP